MTSRHPGGIINRRYLKPLKLSYSRLADAMGVNVSSISRIVNEKADLTSDMAVRVSYVLGGTPEMWMGLQAEFNLAKAKEAFNPEGLTRLNPDFQAKTAKA